MLVLAVTAFQIYHRIPQCQRHCRRFTFVEFCYALILVSDDLSNEQLMRCDSAERILAKRREQQVAPSASSSTSSSSSSSSTSSSSSAAPSVPLAADSNEAEDTPRSIRLLLFVQVRLSLFGNSSVLVLHVCALFMLVLLTSTCAPLLQPDASAGHPRASN
jgi:hypothetical protein